MLNKFARMGGEKLGSRSVDRLWRYGYTVTRNVISYSNAINLSRLAFNLVTIDGPNRKFPKLCRHLDNQELGSLAKSTRISSLVRAISGWKEVYFWSSGIFMKSIGDKGAPLHADADYWPPECHQSITLWIALTDMAQGSSQLILYPGSHLSDFIENENRGKLVGSISAGDTIAFTAKLLHRSQEHHCIDPRIAFALRFSPILCKGQPDQYDFPSYKILSV